MKIFVFAAITTTILLGSLKTEAHTIKSQTNLRCTEQFNDQTPWGNFLTSNLGFPIDENTEKTIQKYLGNLPDAIQQELQTFIVANKSLFPDIENLMYGLGTLLHEVSRQQFIDDNGINIINKIVENVSYTHNDENLDKIDEAIETWKEFLGKNTEMGIAIFETIYNNTKDPVQKEKIGKELSELKENYQRLLVQRERTQKAGERAQKAGEEEAASLKEVTEKSLDLYQRYKKNPKPGMEDVLFKVVDNFKKVYSLEELSPELQDMIKDMDKIRAKKKQ